MFLPSLILENTQQAGYNIPEQSIIKGKSAHFKSLAWTLKGIKTEPLYLKILKSVHSVNICGYTVATYCVTEQKYKASVSFVFSLQIYFSWANCTFTSF